MNETQRQEWTKEAGQRVSIWRETRDVEIDRTIDLCMKRAVMSPVTIQVLILVTKDTSA